MRGLRGGGRRDGRRQSVVCLRLARRLYRTGIMVEDRCSGSTFLGGSFGAAAARAASGTVDLFFVSRGSGDGRGFEFRPARPFLRIAAARLFAASGGLVLVSGCVGRGASRAPVPALRPAADGVDRRGALPAAADHSRASARLGAEVHGGLDPGGLSDESRRGDSLLLHGSGLSTAARAHARGSSRAHSAQPPRRAQPGGETGHGRLRDRADRCNAGSLDGTYGARIAEPDEGSVHRQLRILRRDRKLRRRKRRETRRNRRKCVPRQR